LTPQVKSARSWTTVSERLLGAVQKMRREQGYNIYKIQAGISYFDNRWVGHTKIWWPKLYPHFLKFDFFLIKDDLQKILDFVEKNILCHLRRFAPQTIKLWTRKS
jgi:hypothetical protein